MRWCIAWCVAFISRIIWVESGHNEKNCHLTAGQWAWQAIRDVLHLRS